MGLGPIGYLYYLLDPNIWNKPKGLDLILIYDYWALRGPTKPNRKLIYILGYRPMMRCMNLIRVSTLGNEMMGLKYLE